MPSPHVSRFTRCSILMLTDKSIVFPHLHIYLKDVGEGFELFGTSIAFYGMIIACGMLLAGVFILYEGKRVGFAEDDLLDTILAGIICGILGARLYYVAFSWDYYSRNPSHIFNIREGGLAIYGGIIGGLLAVIVVCRIKKMDFFKMADVAIFGVVIGQILGRWGNFFNREAFGDYTDRLFAMCIPVDAVRQSGAITDEMYKHLVIIDDIEMISVHPTFLYESLWNLGVLMILFFVVRKYKTWDGEIFFSYLLLYGAGRFWIEGLRTDQLLVPGTHFAVSQCLAAACVVVASGVLYYKWKSSV